MWFIKLAAHEKNKLNSKILSSFAYRKSLYVSLLCCCLGFAESQFWNINGYCIRTVVLWYSRYQEIKTYQKKIKTYVRDRETDVCRHLGTSIYRYKSRVGLVHHCCVLTKISFSFYAVATWLKHNYKVEEYNKTMSLRALIHDTASGTLFFSSVWSRDISS